MGAALSNSTNSNTPPQREGNVEAKCVLNSNKDTEEDMKEI